MESLCFFFNESGLFGRFDSAVVTHAATANSLAVWKVEDSVERLMFAIRAFVATALAHLRDTFFPRPPDIAAP